MLATPADHYLFPFLVAGLVVLRTVNFELFQRFIGPNGTVKELTTFVRQQAGGDAFMDGHAGTVMECFFLCAKSARSDNNTELEQYRQVAADEKANDANREKANRIVSIVRDISFRPAFMSLEIVLAKIDLGFKLS
jgi:hypothetical protein